MQDRALSLVALTAQWAVIAVLAVVNVAVLRLLSRLRRRLGDEVAPFELPIQTVSRLRRPNRSAPAMVSGTGRRRCPLLIGREEYLASTRRWGPIYVGS